MSEQQVKPESPENAVTQTTAKKKKASWLRTILWMLSMMLLVNVVMGVIGYIMHRMGYF